MNIKKKLPMNKRTIVSLCILIVLFILIFVFLIKRNYHAEYTFEFVENIPVIRVSSDNVKDLSFILDTGAPTGVIPISTLMEFAKNNDNSSLIKSFDSSEEVVLSMSMFINSKKEKNRKTNLNYIPKFKDIFSKVSLDGLIGIDAFKNFDYVIFDYHKKRLYLTDSQPTCDVWINSLSQEGCFTIPIYRSDIKLIAKIDSGSASNSFYKDLDNYPEVYTEECKSIATVYSMKIPIQYKIFNLNFSCENGYELDNMPFQDLTAYGEKLFPADITATEKSFDCLLGSDFFQKYTVCFDLKNRKVGLSHAGFWDYIF